MRLVRHAAQHIGTKNPISTIDAAQHELGHVDTHCAVSVSTSPPAQVRAPERTKHSSHDGEHDSPSASDVVQSPAPPFAMAPVASHGLVTHFHVRCAATSSASVSDSASASYTKTSPTSVFVLC